LARQLHSILIAVSASLQRLLVALCLGLLPTGAVSYAAQFPSTPEQAVRCTNAIKATITANYKALTANSYLKLREFLKAQPGPEERLKYVTFLKPVDFALNISYFGFSRDQLMKALEQLASRHGPGFSEHVGKFRSAIKLDQAELERLALIAEGKHRVIRNPNEEDLDHISQYGPLSLNVLKEIFNRVAKEHLPNALAKVSKLNLPVDLERTWVREAIGESVSQTVSNEIEMIKNRFSFTANNSTAAAKNHSRNLYTSGESIVPLLIKHDFAVLEIHNTLKLEVKLLGDRSLEAMEQAKLSQLQIDEILEVASNQPGVSAQLLIRHSKTNALRTESVGVRLRLARNYFRNNPDKVGTELKYFELGPVAPRLKFIKRWIYPSYASGDSFPEFDVRLRGGRLTPNEQTIVADVFAHSPVEASFGLARTLGWPEQISTDALDADPERLASFLGRHFRFLNFEQLTIISELVEKTFQDLPLNPLALNALSWSLWGLGLKRGIDTTPEALNLSKLVEIVTGLPNNALVWSFEEFQARLGSRLTRTGFHRIFYEQFQLLRSLLRFQGLLDRVASVPPVFSNVNVGNLYDDSDSLQNLRLLFERSYEAQIAYIKNSSEGGVAIDPLIDFRTSQFSPNEVKIASKRAEDRAIELVRGFLIPSDYLMASLIARGIEQKWPNLNPLFVYFSRLLFGRGLAQYRRAIWNGELTAESLILTAFIGEGLDRFKDFKFMGVGHSDLDTEKAKKQLEGLSQAQLAVWSTTLGYVFESGEFRQEFTSEQKQSLRTYVSKRGSDGQEDLIKALREFRGHPKAFNEAQEIRFKSRENYRSSLLSALDVAIDVLPADELPKFWKRVMDGLRFAGGEAVTLNQLEQGLIEVTNMNSLRTPEFAVIATRSGEFKDLLTIGNCGVRTCQDFELGSHFESLAGYIADANVQSVLVHGVELRTDKHLNTNDRLQLIEALKNRLPISAVKDLKTGRFTIGWALTNGKVESVTTKVALQIRSRGILKLGLDEKNKNVLVLEPLYSDDQKHSLESGVYAAGIATAKEMNLRLWTPETAKDVIKIIGSRNPLGVYSDIAEMPGIQIGDYWVVPASDRFRSKD